jgi:hypothetical protein
MGHRITAYLLNENGAERLQNTENYPVDYQTVA